MMRGVVACLAWIRLAAAAGSTVDLHAILDAEIEAVESVIALHRRKLSLLERQSTNSTTMSFVSWKPMAPPQPGFESIVVERANHVFSGDVVAIQYLSWQVQTPGRRRKLGHVDMDLIEFFVTATAKGRLGFYDPRTFALMWELQTNLTSSIASIHHLADTASSRCVLALATSDGTVAVFSMLIYQDGRLRVGELPRPRASIERPLCSLRPSIRSLPSFRNVWLPLTATRSSPKGLHLDVTLLFELPTHEPSTVLLLQANYDVHVVVGGTWSGHLAIYNRNGECVVHRHLAHPIRAMAGLLGGSFVYTAGKNVAIMHAPKWDQPVQICPGSVHDIVSLARDLHKTSTVYAGTTAGTVLVFRLYRSSGAQSSVCSVQHQAAVESNVNSSQHVVLSSTKRFFAGVLGQTLVAYEWMDGGQTWRQLFESPTPPNTLAWMIKGTTHDAGLVTVTSSTNGSLAVVVYECLMEPDKASYDISGVRAPLMVIFAGGFIVWQKYRKKTKAGHHVDEEEILRLARHLERQENSRG
ncbi:hypothetical protein Ae201684_007457 [Aphanomyces euteiches]|uniref:Uncharacterized protein n=1 Tax=Aphanomyces euteiches TaxID=100861 RepID=A0A6G0X8T1_9STRA|nr:hypothetical protein Ae201684_007457 [Aphanomyces euteiches]KAH9156659.1 hypothetical protein AeRB84_001460 [Aphanomyces euteiches]